VSYRLLRQDRRNECWTPTYVEGVDRAVVTTGLPLRPADVHEPVQVSLSDYGQEPSDFLEWPCFVVSTAMRAALDRAGVDNIQYWRAEVRMSGVEWVRSDYWLGNVLSVLPCVDRDQSHFQGGPDGSLLSFRVDPARTQGLGLFRLAEDRSVVLVDARVRRHLQQAKLRGLHFQRTGSYDGAGRVVTAVHLATMPRQALSLVRGVFEVLAIFAQAVPHKLERVRDRLRRLFAK
jgi:hypothetical protein